VKLQVSPIQKYIAEGEHQQQDFKFCINDSRKIARTLVAFANTDGGRLLIGVKDNGRVAGVRSDEEYYMVEAAAKLYSKPAISFSSEVWDVDGKMVLEVTIEQGKEKPYLAQTDEGKWLAYIRVNDENILANAILVKSWKWIKAPQGLLIKIDGPRQKLLEMVQWSENPFSLNQFMKNAHISRSQAQNILAEFIALGCVRAIFSEGTFLYKPVSDFLFDQFQPKNSNPQASSKKTIKNK